MSGCYVVTYIVATRSKSGRVTGWNIAIGDGMFTGVYTLKQAQAAVAAYITKHEAPPLEERVK